MAGGRSDPGARKQRLVSELRAFVRREGDVPGIRRFADEVKETRQTWQGDLWPTWGAFLTEAGFTKGEMTQRVPDDDLLEFVAVLTREHGSFPTVAELRFARTTRPTMPTDKTYRTRFGSHPDLLHRLRIWIAERPLWSDIDPVLQQAASRKAFRSKRSESMRPSRPIAGVARMLLGESYVPPVVDCLPELAAGEVEAERLCAERGLDTNVEFERRVGLAFQLLGLDVELLGQGAGRVADGIARCSSGRWAVIYDAKVRRGGFVMGTEDRKFREYIERHGDDLAREGIDSLYFAVVSSSFDEGDVQKAREVVRLTKAKAFILLEATALRALVELKLRTRVLDDWASLERMFTVSSILDLSRVESLDK